MIYKFSVSEIVWSYFGNCFHTATKNGYHATQTMMSCRQHTPLYLLQLPKLHKFTSRKYGVSHTMWETISLFDYDSDRFLAMHHMTFLRHLVQNTTQLTSVKVHSVSFFFSIQPSLLTPYAHSTSQGYISCPTQIFFCLIQALYIKVCTKYLSTIFM